VRGSLWKGNNKKNTSYARPALPSLKGSERYGLTLACVFLSLSRLGWWLDGA